MSFTFRFAIIVLVLVPSFLVAQTPSSLLGRWRSLETSKGGIGAMFEFHADGAVDFSPGAVVESAYRLEGNRLILPPGAKSGPEQKMAIDFIGQDKLHLRPAGMDWSAADSLELVRKGDRPDASNLIFGEWNGIREINGRQLEARWFFYPSGKSLLLIPFLTQHGRFTVKGATIRIELPPGGLIEGLFQVDGGVLKLPGKKTESRYARY